MVVNSWVDMLLSSWVSSGVLHALSVAVDDDGWLIVVMNCLFVACLFLCSIPSLLSGHGSHTNNQLVEMCSVSLNFFWVSSYFSAQNTKT